MTTWNSKCGQTAKHSFATPSRSYGSFMRGWNRTRRPRTVGDHIRRTRLDLKMLQREVAERIGAGETSVFKWEANTVNPGIESMPAIIRFLGYNPLPAADTLGERLVRHRTSLGMTQGEAAKRIDVDAGTLARWERGER